MEAREILDMVVQQQEEAVASSPTLPSLSIVVPTKNEAGNIEPLLKRIENLASQFKLDINFVDDSSDNTPDVIKSAAEKFAFTVNVIARPPERRNGLGKAVVEGLKAANSDWVVVMDGDLQHPPEVIPVLFRRAQTANLDAVIASRLAAGGSTDGLSLFRKFISYALAFLSRFVFAKSLRRISDPMTGFFLIRRSKIDMNALRPDGFKILLEILCRNPDLNTDEIPFKFGERLSGESKANGQEMLRLFQQIVRLRLSSSMHFLKFMTVGVTGLFVNTALMWVFTDLMNIHYLGSAVLATQGSTFWNFRWTEKWVFGDRSKDQSPLYQRMGWFYAINNLLLVARGPLLALMVSFLGINYLIANVLSLAFMTVVRYVVSDNIIWRKEGKNAMPGKEMSRKETTYYYNIHDIIRVRSMQRLPELGYFKTSEAFDNPDIDVLLDKDPQKHKVADSIVYDEVLGRRGFRIVINRGEELTKVYATPLIGKSPHVLYTNVVEPLLRWGFVRKGYALMHGACISFDGEALFITAQTDTGKTTTILYTIQNNPGAVNFLSDDMTIFSREGTVYNYPKPLTISQHTLQAVHGSPLNRRERMFLQIQSRLHSRGGRRFGMLLNSGKIPAATLNAVVQAIIPPPKFMVDKLIPGTPYLNEARLSHIVLIERGDDMEAEINDLEKVNILVANAEDAYGFPPYPVLAEQLSTWNGESLQDVEREIVAATIKDIPGTHLRSSSYGWYKRLPQLVKEVKSEAPAENKIHVLYSEKVSETVAEEDTAPATDFEEVTEQATDFKVAESGD